MISSSEHKYIDNLKQVIKNELTNPTPELVKLFAKQVYDGRITHKSLQQFRKLTKKL